MRAPVVLIDGRSGSGKTELASAIAREWPEVQLLRLDELYPGWDGLEAGSAMLHELLSAERPRWQRWDWRASAPAEWRELDPSRPLIVEGCGALSGANRALATVAIWVELDTETRKRRALERDGGDYAPHWDRWAAQEDAVITREKPRALADLVVDGADVAAAAPAWRALLEGARVGE